MERGAVALICIIAYFIIGGLIALIYSVVTKKKHTWNVAEDPDFCLTMVFAWPLIGLMLFVLFIVDSASKVVERIKDGKE